MKNVLVFPANGPGAVDICSSLKYNLHFNVYGAVGREDHAELHFPNNQYIVDQKFFINNEKFIDDFNLLLQKWSISFIIPTHDTIIRYLTEHQSELLANVVGSPLETVLIAENKKLQYTHLKGKRYCPKVYSVDDIEKYPVFIKPAVAAGGKGTAKIDCTQDLYRVIDHNSDVIISEFLPGEEYTVDCFTNKDRCLLFAGARTRERITSGVAYLSREVEMTFEIRDIAEDLNKEFHFRGAWFFQLKRSADGSLKLMEFSVRHAGTMNFYRQLGVNFTALSLFDLMDYPVQIIKNNFNICLTRGVETLYCTDLEYDVVYLDYDDTLIVNQKVNLNVIRFVYQAINEGKHIILLTKHIGCLETSLHNYRISKLLFDEIISISEDERKEDFIIAEKAIFIDNYFPDRMKVFNKRGIPVFDVDAVECLMHVE